MNQRSSDLTTSPGAEETPNNTQTTNTGRHRRGSSRRRTAPRLVEPATAETATSAPEATDAQPAASESAAPATPELATPATATTSTAKPRSSSRGRRGGSRRRGSETETTPAVTAEEAQAAQAPEAGAPGAPVETLPIPASEDASEAIPSNTDAAAAAVADFVASLGAQPGNTAATAQEPSLVPTLTEPAAQAPAPARRYRFDRRPRATTFGAATPLARPERLSGISAPADYTEAAAPEETGQPALEASAEPATALPAPEPITPDQAENITQEPVSIELPRADEAVATEATEEETPAEVAAEPAVEGEGPATRRRRRRRRGTGTGVHATDIAETDGEEESPAPPRAATQRRGVEPYSDFSAPVAPGREGRNGYGAYDDYEQPYAPYMPAARDRAQQQDNQAWNIGSAYQQMNQPTSPFGAPEPSFARGFGPQPSGVAGPAREVYPRTGRPERGIDAPPMSANQLGTIITQAISRQTDRLLAELRHQQQPPSMTVMLPSLSTERVGIFVDVANLLYSARSLHVSVDFGRLLDFLRGNRRLVRAHAYAPTNPEPQADQQFLSAVKGLGYRITTKNYKTFASGAKKADLDLDLCMDIVRLVDAGAVDTIVLVSGDSDFLPLLEYCSDHGVRVEVAAFEDAAAQILRQSCDLFINLSMVDEIRG